MQDSEEEEGEKVGFERRGYGVLGGEKRGFNAWWENPQVKRWIAARRRLDNRAWIEAGRKFWMGMRIPDLVSRITKRLSSMFVELKFWRQGQGAPSSTQYAADE